MIERRQPLIIRQAFLPLSVLIILALIVHYQFGFIHAIGLWVVVAITMFFFRDPRRQVPPIPLAVVAPIDGHVACVDEVYDPYLKRQAVRIQMSGSVTGVFTVRSSMEGKVQNQWYGTLPKGSELGIYATSGIPKFAQWTQSDEGDDIVTAMSPKVLSTGLRCNVSSGERIGQGKRCSFVPFGSNAEVLLSENTRVDVKAGDKIRAGSSVIATLVH